MKIKTERLIIRTFESKDDKDLYEICKDIETCYKAGWMPHKNINVTRDVILNYMCYRQTFAIELQGKVIGTISLYEDNFRKTTNALELGFSLNKTYRGNGFMTEAVRAILNYAFTVRNAPCVFICHQVDNYDCEKLVKKFEFTYEGTIRSYRKMYDGSIVDVKMYSMKNNEFKGELL